MATILDEIIDIVAPMSDTDVEYWRRRDREHANYEKDGIPDSFRRADAADSIGNYIDSMYSVYGDRISPKRERMLQRMQRVNWLRDRGYLPERTPVGGFVEEGEGY